MENKSPQKNVKRLFFAPAAGWRRVPGTVLYGSEMSIIVIPDEYYSHPR